MAHRSRRDQGYPNDQDYNMSGFPSDNRSRYDDFPNNVSLEEPEESIRMRPMPRSYVPDSYGQYAPDGFPSVQQSHQSPQANRLRVPTRQNSEAFVAFPSNTPERNNSDPFLRYPKAAASSRYSSREYLPTNHSPSPTRSYREEYDDLSRTHGKENNILEGSDESFEENPFLETASNHYPVQQQAPHKSRLRSTHDFSTSVFGDYQFDNDEDNQAQFVPFPVIDNSYYPINTYDRFYNPFADEANYDDRHSREGVEDYDDEYTQQEEPYYPRTGAPAPPVEYLQRPIEEEEEEEGENIAARQVRMVNGNLILDCPVSDVLLSKYKTPLTEKDREFLFMRFQACTCEPSEFVRKNFSLRQRFYSQPRETELMIVVTMYNESDVHLARTLKGIFKNIRYLYSLDRSTTWGRDAWQKVVVVIVSDGRSKIHPKAKALLGALGVYQEGFAKDKVNDDKVVSHIYEYTTMVGISSVEGDHVKLTTDNQIPIQMVFCLKENNQQKINSHSWAFEAFGPVLNPNVVVLVDVGTEPTNKSIYKLWKAFKDPRIAGACGEIKASLGKGGKLLLNPLIAAQNFEYKISNILDKPMESVFGFVTVLPGAFSAYRYQALLGAPLDKYLKGEDLKKTNDGGIFNANMYLAEDRILCFELIAKKNCEWLLKYVNTASASTDVPEELHDFISQRRRWLNGSFFAAAYSIFHFYKVWGTSHSLFRKILLHIEFLYQLLNLLVSWFSLGSYFLVFRILTVYLAEPDADFAPGNILSVCFLWLYMASLVTTFVLSFGNKPKGTKKFYLVIVSFFAILMCYMIFAAVYMSVKSIEEIYDEYKDNFSFKIVFTETRFRDLIIATMSTYALYFIGSFIFLEPFHMFTSFVQYLLLSPAYINVLNIYAFCNIHDISWGTKGTDEKSDLGVAKTASKDGELEIVIPTTQLQIDNAYKKIMNELMAREIENNSPRNLEEEDAFYFAFIRSMTVLLWMCSNFIVVALVTETGGLYQFTPNDTSKDVYLPDTRVSVYLTVILWLVAFMALFRFLGCVAYLILKLVDSIRQRSFRRDYGLKGASYGA